MHTDLPGIREIFPEIRIGDERQRPPYAGAWVHVRLHGRLDTLEVRVDARPHRVGHWEAVAISGWSPESVPGQIAHKAGMVRDRSAYKALRTLEDVVRVPGIGRWTHWTEYASQALFFLRGLYSVLHGFGRITHVLMPTDMHREYCRSLDLLAGTSASHDPVVQNASPYGLCGIRIIPSLAANRDSSSTAYAVDSTCALCFRWPISCRSRMDVEGRYAAIETSERYQFMLLSEENTRTASGMPYRARPGFRIKVGIV